MTNNTMMELNMDEMEIVNGGWSWEGFGLGALTGAGYGGLIVGSIALVASGPIGWCALGGAAVGAAVVGTVGAIQCSD